MKGKGGDYKQKQAACETRLECPVQAFSLYIEAGRPAVKGSHTLALHPTCTTGGASERKKQKELFGLTMFTLKFPHSHTKLAISNGIQN